MTWLLRVVAASLSPDLDARSESGWWPPPLWATLPEASRALAPIWAFGWRSWGSSGAPSAAWASSWSTTGAGAAAEEGRPTTMSRMQKRVWASVCVCLSLPVCLCACVGEYSELLRLKVLELGSYSAGGGRKSKRDGERDDGEEAIPARGEHH